MKKNPSLFVILLLVLCCSVYTVKQRWQGDNGQAWKSVISADGYGYYAYLPCIFIYHKLEYKKTYDPIIKLHPEYSTDFVSTSFAPDIYSKSTEKVIDRYPIGTAILIIPFFLLAYFLSFITGTPIDGYGFLFQASVSIAALFYMVLGLIYLRKLLKLYNISEWGIAITCIVLVAATNLTYYSTMETSMSHVYSFGLTAFFLYYTKRAIESFRLKHLALMVISVVILVLVRPTNVLTALLIPFLAGTPDNTKKFFAKIFTSYKTILLLLLIGLSVFSLQLFIWHAETGRWFVWSHVNEGFNFGHPHFFDILFSYRKGWFIYTPVMFILLASGLIAQFRQDKFKFLVMLLYFVITTYVLSSWWYWAYGGSYGSRPFIDFYPAFCLLPVFWYNTITKSLQKIILVLFVVLFCTLNLIQVYQYTHAIIPYDNKFMNGKMFWKMFLETSPIYEWEYMEPPDTNDYVFDNKYEFKNNFEHNTWGSDNTLTTIAAHSGKYSACITKNNIYSPTLVTHAYNLPKDTKCAYISMWFYTSHKHDNATLTISVTEKDSVQYFSAGRQLAPFAFDYNAWNNTYWIFTLPDFKSPNDIIKVFAVETEGTVLIDDIDVKFGNEKP